MRICSKCGAEIPSGELFCPVCGEEVQLVADYETMESRAHVERQKQLEKESRERQEAEIAAREMRARQRKRKKRIRIACVSVVLLIGIAIAGLVLNYSMHGNSFTYQYDKAMECYEEKDYANALVYIQKAMKLTPDSAEGGVLLGRIQEGLGNDQAACQAYETVIEYHPDYEEAYDQLVPLYVKLQDYDSLQVLLQGCGNADIQNKYKDYITYEPVFSIEEGDYAEAQTLQLTTNGNGSIYYTLDGTDPTDKSTKYTAAIVLNDGENVVKAIYISPQNICSKIVTKTYNISTASPTAPKITPASGVYTETEDGKDPEITIVVPTGYTCYYSFDQKATTTSLRYTGPVSMRSGTHIFYAVLVSSDGKIGDVASATYVYNKTTVTPTTSTKKNSSSENSDSSYSSNSNNSSDSNNSNNSSNSQGTNDDDEKSGTSSDDTSSESEDGNSESNKFSESDDSDGN